MRDSGHNDNPQTSFYFHVVRIYSSIKKIKHEWVNESVTTTFQTKCQTRS